MDREATSEDLDALREFARTRVGVEFFVEPETMVTDTTVVVVAADGEWTRRRVGSLQQVIRQVAKQLQLPVYDADRRLLPSGCGPTTPASRPSARPPPRQGGPS